MYYLFTLLIGCTTYILPLSGSTQVVNSQIVVTLLEAPNHSPYKVGDDYVAFLTYDTSGLVGVGEETLSHEGVVSLLFEFNGITYDETYDTDSSYPKFYFSGSELVSIDYMNSQGLVGAGAGSFFKFYRDQSFNYSPNGESEYAGVYVVNQVPEFKTMIYFSSAFCILLYRRRYS